MNDKALINKKEIVLERHEIEKAAAFHKERVAFALIKDRFVFNNNPNDERDHQNWLCEDYQMSIEEFEHIIRGYMKPGIIILYHSSNFDCIDLSLFTVSNLQQILDEYRNFFKTEAVTVYNGVIIGMVGEIWPPKELIAKIML